jgi:ATP-dependent RNA helicase DHX57
MKEEGGSRKEEGGRRKEEGGRRKEEGGRRKEEEGSRRKREEPKTAIEKILRCLLDMKEEGGRRMKKKEGEGRRKKKEGEGRRRKLTFFSSGRSRSKHGNSEHQKNFVAHRRRLYGRFCSLIVRNIFGLSGI